MFDRKIKVFAHCESKAIDWLSVSIVHESDSQQHGNNLLNVEGVAGLQLSVNDEYRCLPIRALLDIAHQYIGSLGADYREEGFDAEFSLHATTLHGTLSIEPNSEENNWIEKFDLGFLDVCPMSHLLTQSQFLLTKEEALKIQSEQLDHYEQIDPSIKEKIAAQTNSDALADGVYYEVRMINQYIPRGGAIESAVFTPQPPTLN